MPLLMEQQSAISNKSALSGRAIHRDNKFKRRCPAEFVHESCRVWGRRGDWATVSLRLHVTLTKYVR